MMTKEDVLKELDALSDLTNSTGHAMIANVRAWVEHVTEEKPLEMIYKEPEPEIQAAPAQDIKPVAEKPKPAHVKHIVKKVLKKK